MPACRICKTKHNVQPVSVHVDDDKLPPILVLSGEYSHIGILDQPKRSTKMRAKKEPVIQPSPSPLDSKSAPITTTSAKETSGFEITRRVEFEGQAYHHLLSIIASPGHFWTVITYKGQTWIGGIDSEVITHYGADDFVTKVEHDGRPMQPMLHIYGKERGDNGTGLETEKARENIDGGLSDVMEE